MSQIDNDGPFFEFDPYEGSIGLTSAMQRMPETELPPLVYSTSDGEAQLPAEPIQDLIWKGKGVSKPMPIRSPVPTSDPHDLFDISSAAGTSSHSHPAFSSFTPSLCYTPIDSIEQSPTSVEHDGFSESPLDSSLVTGKGKGKEKEQPPTLPPLTFSPTEFGYGHTNWPSPSTGPSSYSSLAPLDLIAPTPPPPVLQVSSPSSSPGPSLPRRRSLPTLAASPRAVSKFRLKVKAHGNLARKLLFRKYDGDACPTPPSSPTESIDTQLLDWGSGNCLAPWRTDSKLSRLPVEFPLALEYQSLPSPPGPLSGKGRTQSSPLPFSALDLIPSSTSDIFVPIPLIIPNHFDILPEELRLSILISLIAVHEADHARALRNEQWTVVKASSSRNRWIGRDKAVRELVRFSRVSKSWQTLVFDGQIWANLDLHAFPLLPKSLLLRIARTAGSFVENLNVAGHVNLHSGTLIEVTDNLSALSVGSGSLPFTNLTGINLRGCSALTTRSLHHLLMHSRALENLCLKALPAVTNTTCDIIAVYCTQLISLDLGKCKNIDAAGIRSLANSATSRGEYLLLKELRISGLKHVDDNMMASLGRAAPYLEVLDLSYMRQLHNTAVEAFVACDNEDVEDEEAEIEIVCLTAREAGRKVDESNSYRRRVTRLRHLSLSSCILLTDAACSNLAYSVPRLEFLELAGIGGSIEDEGLIRLLNTTPLIRKLDLEDASSISDAVLATLTPAPEPEEGDTAERPEPQLDSPLEHLIISGALEITDDAFLALIRGCTRLTVLEADNTRMGSVVLKEFIRTSRKRRLEDAKIVAIDCRGFGETLLKDLAVHTRPRRGWRAYEARGLKYLDARDGNVEDLKIGQDELDSRRVVIKTFYSWQTVDAVQAAREKRRKLRSRRAANDSSGSSDLDELSGRITRWWSPGGRRSGTNSPPIVPDLNNDGCITM
ncbi:F-box domain-containing protein [Mycena rebaudengoi]|nr:F-box domain-containing protein [Mycena rebaudengoi]